MPKKANIVVFKKKNILLEHKKILIVLVVILIAVPVTVYLALNRQSFLNFADAGSIIDSVEVSPGEIIIDVNDDPLALSALAYDIYGEPIYYLDINYDWSMSSTNTVGTLTRTSGENTEFIPLAFGCGQLTVTASMSQESITESILVSVKDGDNIPVCGGEPTSSIEPTVPVCEQSTIPPETGPAPLTVFLHGGGSAGGLDSTIEGYQWDFENDGTWDTEIILDPLSHTYENPGIYDPKYRILGANGLYSEICDYKYQIVVGELSSTILNLNSVKLHGIGKGGDNTNASIAGNLNPLRTTRDLNIFLEDSIGKTIAAGTGQVNYSSSSGVFSGKISLPDTILSGNYLLKIKSPQYLRRQVGGILSIGKGEVTSVPEFSLVTGDIDNNNKVDVNDYNLLIDCYSDLLPARNCNDDKKLKSDLSDDGYVNADDYNLFIRELSVASGD